MAANRPSEGPEQDGQGERDLPDGATAAREVCALEGCDVPLPRRPLDEHGRLRGGRRPRYCSKPHADAASRQRRARDVAAVADPLDQVRAVGEALLPTARELAAALTGLTTRLEQAEAGALGRVLAAEQECAEAHADAHAAREAAEAAEQSRRQAVARSREDRQARDNAVREADRTREDTERARAQAWEQVAEHERARGQAEAARAAAEQAAQALAVENRQLRARLEQEQARTGDLAERAAAARADLERARGEGMSLSVRLEAAEHSAREGAATARRELDRAADDLTRARAEADRTRRDAEHAVAAVRGELEAVRAQAQTLREELAAARAAHDADRGVMATLREALAAGEQRFDALQAALDHLAAAGPAAGAGQGRAGEPAADGQARGRTAGSSGT